MSKVFDTKLHLSGDSKSKVIGYSYSSDRPLSKGDIIKKVEKIKKGFKGNYEMMITVNTEFGYRNGRAFDTKQRVLLCDDYEWEEATDFVIYVWKKQESTGGEDDEFNDCLYDSIVDIMSKFKLPKDYKNPEDLKKHLGLNRDDKIPLNLIPDVENLYKININVVGDYVQTSSNSYPTKQTINLILHNEHYALNEELISTGKLGAGITKRQFELVLCDERADHVCCYDGDDEFKISYDTYFKEKNDVRKTGISYINKWEKTDRKTKQKIDIITAYNQLKLNTKTLLELTKGKYDLSRAMFKVPELMRRILADNLKSYAEPEPLTELEQHWVYYTNCNAIIFASKCELDNAYSYDKNGCYPSVMSSSTFSFPVKQGVFSRIEELPDILPYGIYRVEVERSGEELTDRFFRFNGYNYYTHFNINHARVLGLKITLIKDGEANTLQYTKDRVKGNSYFLNVVNELYKIKKECPLAKSLLSCMWGMLCSKNIIKRTTRKSPIHLKSQKIESIKPLGGDDVIVGYLPDKKFYKYDYARIGVFLTSCNNYQMAKLLYPYTENIVQMHTDG